MGQSFGRLLLARPGTDLRGSRGSLITLDTVVRVGDEVAETDCSVVEGGAWCCSATGPVFGNGRSISVGRQPGLADGAVDGGGMQCGDPALGAK